MNIEIIGSGALGRFLAYSLSEYHTITLRSLRTYLPVSHVVNKNAVSQYKRVTLSHHSLGLNLRIYASTLSQLNLLPSSSIPTLILSNGSLLIDTMPLSVSGVVSYLTVNATSDQHAFEQITSSGLTPTVYLSHPLDITSTELLRVENDPDGILQIEKCLRTIFYIKLAGEERKSFFVNRQNSALIMRLLTPISHCHPRPSHFVKSTIEVLNSMSPTYIPTIARADYRSQEESSHLLHLFQRWSSRLTHSQDF